KTGHTWLMLPTVYERLSSLYAWVQRYGPDTSPLQLNLMKVPKRVVLEENCKESPKSGAY
ncbi:hypothetical protein ACJO3K_25225, partial [Vibrio parahaemolyticus]|uniref:hypothetical protein n=1 Tax=Vibrio parahaemolyticus TaxID=670 RepID=UPI00387B1EF3